MIASPVDLSAAIDRVEKVRKGLLPAESLVALLAEQAPFLHLAGTPEVERFRGYVLSTFATVGLPANARDIVLEELETGTEPHTVAAAALALQGSSDRMDGTIDLLKSARNRIVARDVHVQYEQFGAIFDLDSKVTASSVIDDAIGRLAAADRPLTMANPPAAPIEDAQCCCCAGGPSISSTARIQPHDLALQDQTGADTTFGEFFRGHLGVLTFFYTRCMNPEKCSLTISNLARLRRSLAAGGLDGHVRIGAITYDPAYDLPYRLAAYGRERGLVFDESCRMFRSPAGFEQVQDSFELGVGFGPQTVNRHQIELLLLDRDTVPFKRFSRLKWNVDEVVELMTAEAGRTRSAA